MDVYVIIYFLGIAVGAFAEAEERLIIFYEDRLYRGESTAIDVSVGTPEGSPCGYCYNFTGDVANQLKFRRPGSIELPPDHYIRLYENFNCHGNHIKFCGTACNCDSSHIDLSGDNHKCYVPNISRNFCPGDTDLQSAYERQYICYGDQPGLYSFSVHKIPEGGQILRLKYPGSVFGKRLSFEKCTANDILRRTSTTNELPTCSCDVKVNNLGSEPPFWSGEVEENYGGEYCFLRKWLAAMHYRKNLLQFTRRVNDNEMISGIDWSFLVSFGKFFGVQPRYDDDYENLLYAVLVKTIKNAVPREHKEALRICASKVSKNRYDAYNAVQLRNVLKVLSDSEEAHIKTFTYHKPEDLRISKFWNMIKSALDIVIGIPEGQELKMSEDEVESFYRDIDDLEIIWKSLYFTKKQRVRAYFKIIVDA